MARSQAPKDIDDYIARFPADVAAILEKVRATIKTAAPEATERIGYGMPAFQQHGILVYFAGWKKHVGLYPPVSGDKALEKAVARYSGPKGNLQFPLDEPIPYHLIARIARLRVRQDLAKAAANRKKQQKQRRVPRSTPMEIEIMDEPIRFTLHGLSSRVEDRRYGEVGLRLMDEMWRIIKQAKLATTGINHWVYLAGDRMFVGVEVKTAKPSLIPGSLEPCDLQLKRYSKHVHVGPYHELPQKWEALQETLTARGESVTMPSLEVYGHSCDGADDAQAETTILAGLKPRTKAPTVVERSEGK